MYRSAELEELWPFGFSSVGDVTLESAGYVARYVFKKRLTSGLGDSHYDIVNPDTGEVFRRRAEYCRMSTRPGLGSGWLEKFHKDVFPHGKVVIDAHEADAPRFYGKWFKDVDAVGADALARSREEAARKGFSETSSERLRAREAVELAKVKLLERKL